MRKNASKTINDEYYQGKGYDADIDLDSKGKPKRGLVSFQIEQKIWKEFDKLIEEKYGRYKKSYILENLIRKFIKDSEQKK